MLKGIFHLFLSLIVTISLSACGGSAKRFVALEGSMLGTRYHITAELSREAEREVGARVEELDAKMKHEMSIFDKTSILSQINRGETDRTTEWIDANICLADSISRLSGGVYDITCAPLVAAWGFGRGGRSNLEAHPVPNIDSLLQFVGYEGIRIEDGQIIKRDSRMQIDLNSIAKGFAVDQLAKIIEELGAENYMVDIGGELRLGGNNPHGAAWRVGVESPIDGNMTEGDYLEQRVAIAADCPLRAVATSGNYRRFYLDANGDKVVHIIDPTTGRAASSSLLSVTVLARSCAEADALATMLLAAGDTRAEALAESIEGCEVYLIYNKVGEDGYREYFSDGMKSLLME